MDEREKIINIIQSVGYCAAAGGCDGCKYDVERDNYSDMSCRTLRIADALVAAGIGDVTAHEPETGYWKTICKIESDEHHTAIKNAAEHARHLMQERDEYKHRTEVAEQVLHDFAILCGMGDAEQEEKLYNDWLLYGAKKKLSEKELAEDKEE